MLNYCELFHSIQGEGSTVGRNVVFLRLSGCTLRCSFCDSKYSYIVDKKISHQEVIDFYKKSNAQGLVITGGEPLLQQKEIFKLLQEGEFPHIEIETNATLAPIVDLQTIVDIWNVSPKLENSQNSKEKRYKKEVLDLHSKFANSIFKFVVSSEKDLEEIKEIIKNSDIPRQRVYLMAEGFTRADQFEKMERVVEMAKKEGFNYSPRIHTLIWDSKRKV